VIVFAVAGMGALGAVTRFFADGVCRAKCGDKLPWGTIFINVSGSLLLGVLTGLVLYHRLPTTLTVIAGTGFCGGYTTFSTASFESVRLIQQRFYVRAAANTFGTLFVTIAAAALGLALTAN
jgi:CrcB protein